MSVAKIKPFGLYVILFLIWSLIICSILGCSREGMETIEEEDTASSVYLTAGETFKSESGGMVEVVDESTIKVSKIMGSSSVTFTASKPSDGVESFVEYFTATRTVFYGPNGETATVVSNNGQAAVRVSYPDNSVYLYTNTSQTNASVDVVTGQYGNAAYVAEGPNGGTAYGTTANVNTSGDASVTTATGPGGTTVGYATGPNGNSAAGVNQSQIPAGSEDLYILKSQIVPPVCPACPVSSACPRTEKPPPCPACARCPEPSFECKKIPNYSSADVNILPLPMLTDFTSFGM